MLSLGYAIVLDGGLLCAVAFAQVSAASGDQFKDAIRSALGTHPQVRAAQAKLEASRFTLSSAEWGRYPSLQAEMSRNNSGDLIKRAQLSQPLWAGGRIDGEIDASGAKVLVATESVRESELSITDQMVTAGVDLAKARAQLARANESLAGYQKLLDAIERRADGGLGLQSDVTLARSRIAQARANAAQYEANERRANTRWLALTGQSMPTLVIPETTAADSATLNELLEEAKAFSPAVQRLKAEAEAAGFDAEVTQASIWPQLSARAIRTWQTGTVHQNDTQYLAVLEYQPGAGIGVIDKARAAYSQRDAAMAQIDRSMRDVEEQIRLAYSDRIGFQSRIEALLIAATANAEAIDSFLRQYNIGKRSWLDVLNAQREWTESVLLAEETKYNALAAAYKLAVFSGRFFKQ